MDADPVCKKKLKFTWRRIRKWLKPLQNPEEYQERLVQLCGLLWLDKEGYVNLYFGDETRISMNSYLPSAWQQMDAQVSIIPQKNTGINVFGLLNRSMDFHPYTIKKTVTSAVIIAFIDDFIKHAAAGKKVIVLDNATIHRSEEFKDAMKRWETEDDLHIFFLPRYAPHLNLIEILWKKIKYEWLQQNLLTGTDSFFQQVDEILLAVGVSLNINWKKWLLPN